MSNLVFPTNQSPELRLGLLNSQLEEVDMVLSSGEAVNNRLAMDFNEVPEHLRSAVVDYATWLIVKENVRSAFLAPIPGEADEWAIEIAKSYEEQAKAPITVLDFQEFDEGFFIESDKTSRIIDEAVRPNQKPAAIVIDGASYNQDTSEALADKLTLQGLDVVMCLSLFFRGEIKDIESKYRRVAALAWRVPLMVDWATFRESGVTIPLKDEATPALVEA